MLVALVSQASILLNAYCPRWAQKGTAGTQPSRLPPPDVMSSWEETSCTYSHATMKSLELVDEDLVNYDLLEALVVHIVETESAQGPGSLLRVSLMTLG